MFTHLIWQMSNSDLKESTTLTNSACTCFHLLLSCLHLKLASAVKVTKCCEYETEREDSYMYMVEGGVHFRWQLVLLSVPQLHCYRNQLNLSLKPISALIRLLMMPWMQCAIINWIDWPAKPLILSASKYFWYICQQSNFANNHDNIIAQALFPSLQ